MAYIDGKLEHSEPILDKGFPEITIGFFLLLCFRWEIKEYKNPHNSVLTEALKACHTTFTFLGN